MARPASLFKPSLVALALAGAFAAAGCGGGDSGASSPAAPPAANGGGTGGSGGGSGGGSATVRMSGTFLDSAVEGLAYRAASGSGTTDAQGQFSCVQGETVAFSLGGVALGQAACGSVLTPLDLAGTADSTDAKVVNRLQLLQSLDEDGDPANGIRITAASAQALAGKSIDLTQAGDAFGTALAALLPAANDARGLPYNLRDTSGTARQLAREHFENTLATALAKPTTSTVADSVAGAVQYTKYVVQADARFFVPYEGDNAAVKRDFPQGFYPAAGSGLAFKGRAADGSLQFYGVTDRGPNGDGPTAPTPADTTKTGASKVFPAPSFVPSLGLFSVGKGGAVLQSLTPLSVSDTVKASGRPLQSGVGATMETPLTDRLVYDAAKAGFDANGIDPESVVVDEARKALWISDEYGPFIAKVDPATGRILKKYQPGTGAADLPLVLSKRRANRGMEGLTLDKSSGVLHGFLQSPIDDGKATLAATGKSEKVQNYARFLRWVAFDPATETSRLYALPVDAALYKDGKTGNAKMGDLAWLGGNRFMAVEQGAGPDGKVFNWLVLIEIPTNATDITAWGSDLEKSSMSGKAVNGADFSTVVTLRKTRLLDLNAAGWVAEKAEGLAVVDANTVALMNDNDFGLRSILVDANGKEVAGSLEDCTVNAQGQIVAGCPAGTAGARVAPGVASERPVRLWLIKFPQALASYKIPQ